MPEAQSRRECQRPNPGLALGIFLCVYPAVTVVLLPIMLGIWLMYHSFMMIAFGGDLETFKIGGSGWVVFGAQFTQRIA